MPHITRTCGLQSDEFLRNQALREKAISPIPTLFAPARRYVHLQPSCKGNTKVFLVPVRNPVTRIHSWFHFEQDLVTKKKISLRGGDHVQSLIWLLDCYSSFDTLVAQGLVLGQNISIMPTTKNNGTTTTAGKDSIMMPPD
jgi:hypothetical protein